jgi:soluble lytic murein transglycosylase-like protein
MRWESEYNRFAKSKTGDYGLMQINYKSWKSELNKSKLYDINYNVDKGCKILNYYINKNKGNVYRALIKYNGNGRKSKEYSKRIIYTYIKLLES